MSEYYIKKTGEILKAVSQITLDGLATLDSGAQVRAKRGDYIVTYPDGSQRVTSAEAFPLLYGK